MTAKEYVKQFYPNSRIERDGMVGYEIWSGSSAFSVFDDMIIGEGDSKQKAWEDAMSYVLALPADLKPKIKS